MDFIDWKLVLQLVVYIVTIVSVYWNLKNKNDNNTRDIDNVKLLQKDFQTGVSGILKDMRYEVKEEIKALKCENDLKIKEIKDEFRDYKSHNDGKFKEVFETINEHYRNLDNKISELIKKLL